MLSLAFLKKIFNKNSSSSAQKPMSVSDGRLWPHRHSSASLLFWPVPACIRVSVCSQRLHDSLWTSAYPYILEFHCSSKFILRKLSDFPSLIDILLSLCQTMMHLTVFQTWHVNYRASRDKGLSCGIHGNSDEQIILNFTESRHRSLYDTKDWW